MIRAFQWDLARQVERLEWLLAQLPRYADWGYQELYLHLEDAVEYPSLPGVARQDAYSHRQMARLVAAADRAGIKVVPIVNLLGHTQYLIKVPELRDLNELRAADGTALEQGQVCPVHPRTLEVAASLLRDVRPFCSAGKVHVGLDESFHLGKHPLSRREIGRIGLPAHFARYVSRLRDLTGSLGLGMGMWSDMLYFLPEAAALLPKDVAMYEWYYYAFRGRPRVEMFNFSPSDVGDRLAARGNPYWGCPMNGAFRFEPLPHFSDRLDNIVSWWRRCRSLKAQGMLVTSWEPYRLAIELTTVIDAAAASLWLDGIDDPRRMLERGFARCVRGSLWAGCPHPATASGGDVPRGEGTPPTTGAKAAARAALACDKYPFAGYPRWQINSRWDVVPKTETLTHYRAEERHFHALLKKSGALPEPLRESIALRWYLAARDVAIREWQRKPPSAAGDSTVRAFKSALRAGLKATRAMWVRTRDPRVRGPNENILRADAERIKALVRGGPVLGPGWQLCYRVENVAPAVQLVAVEQQGSDGTWETKQACHTIEFQARAAQPRGGLVRDHAAPVDWDGDGGTRPRLRIVLRGVGQVKLSHVVLTDGTVRHRIGLERNVLGRPAPRRGFPRIDWTRNKDVIRV